LIRKKKFERYLIDGCYPIGFDGTQKMVRGLPWSEDCLQRRVGAEEEKKKQYYVYVLELNLVFENGMVIPLMSEFLEYRKGDTAEEKQDSESRGFFRLAERLKEAFPRTRFLVLQDGSLPYVWEEYRGLKGLLGKEDRLENTWADRKQKLHWVNDIEYPFGSNRGKKQTVHMVVCEESWERAPDIGGGSSRESWWRSAAATTTSTASPTAGTR